MTSIPPNVCASRRLWAAIALLILALAGCGGPSTPQMMPTAIPLVETLPPTDIPAPLSPTITPTAPPAIVLSGAAEVSVACESNTLRVALAPDGEPVGAASRIAAVEDDLYLVLDGNLYRVSQQGVDSGTADLEPALLRGERVADRLVQEIVDLAYRPGDGEMFLLDKAGHIYGYDIASGVTRLRYRVTPEAIVDLTEQLVAVAVGPRGQPVVLDTVFGRLWTPDGSDSLDMVAEAPALTDGVDFDLADGEFYVLRRDESIVAVGGATGSRGWLFDEERGLGLSLKASRHLGVDSLVIVDAVHREVSTLLVGDRTGAGGSRVLTRHVFAMPGIGLLRDAVFAGGRLYALADGDLYVFPGPASGTQTARCAPPGESSFARPQLYGVDVLAAMRGWSFPIEGGTLPVWPRVYPGASRIYRVGVHRGLDIYYWDGPEGYGEGWPVLAASDGEVVLATTAYTPLTADEYDQLVAGSIANGGTPPDALFRFGGRQVGIEHGGGIRTVYEHLEEVDSAVRAGEGVRAEQVIGTVGATGTEGEARPDVSAPHLHLEIWIGDRYLGEGITIRETMWWFEQIFGG
jgi:hypothetical protein